MRSLVMIFQCLAMGNSIFSPFLLIIYFVASKSFFFMCIGLSVLVQFFLLFIVEKIFYRLFYKQCKPLPASYALFLQDSSIAKSKLPQFYIYHDPYPQVLMARSLGGTGKVLMTQGLVNALSESELQSFLRCCIQQVRSPEMVLRSYGITWIVVSLLNRYLPWVHGFYVNRTWTVDKPRNPFLVLIYVMILGWVEFLLNQSGWRSQNKKFSRLLHQDSSIVFAMKKIDCFNRLLQLGLFQDRLSFYSIAF